MVRAKIRNTSLKNDTYRGNKMAKCKVCKVKFEPKFFLQKACLNPACLAEWSKIDREVKADKAHIKRKKEFKNNDKSLRDKEAQKAFNAFIRMNDDNLPCISCNEFRQQTAVSSGSNWHAGHYKTRGARSSLRFNEDNCHKQCAHCNNFLSGNIENYRINLSIHVLN